MISVCEWEWEGCDDRGGDERSQRSGLLSARLWCGFTRRALGAWCSLARVAAAGLCHTALIAPRDRPVRAGSDLQPTHIAAWLWMGQTWGGETLCFPLCLYHFPARSLILCGYLLQPTVLFSLPPSPPSFRQLQVCVHSTEEMCWLAYKGPGIKMDQEILVPLYTESLPSHGSKCHSPTPWPTHSFGKKGDEKLLPHCCCHLPAARWNIPSQ